MNEQDDGIAVSHESTTPPLLVETLQLECTATRSMSLLCLSDVGKGGKMTRTQQRVYKRVYP